MPTILITGANRGLGLEFAKQYAADGWRVLATLRDPLQGAALSATGAEIYVCDVSSPAQISQLANTLRGVQLDILLANAGQYPDRDGLGAVEAESFLQGMAVNALAPVLLAQAFLPALTGRKIIAALSSKMGSIAENTTGGSYAYRASKAALNMAYKSLSLDPAAQDAIVVLLSPGWVQTDMGGAQAPLAPPQAIAGMRKVLAEVTRHQSGAFIHYDGSTIAW